MSSRPVRLAQHSAVSTELALLSDEQLRSSLEAAVPLGRGIGGTVAQLDVAGVRVFAKRVRLTALERLPENARSTANLFGLPMFYQYGVGSSGFGAWRELAAQLMTTTWVLTGEADGFPLLHHWRVLTEDAAAPPTRQEQDEIDFLVAHWEGAPAVRTRLEALQGSTASVVLFLEHIPYRLGDWLPPRLAEGGEAAAAAFAMVERELTTAVDTMNSRGLQHFDAHFHNVLTDGQQIYLADFGLALSDRFDLTGAEADFLRRHRSYDSSYVAARLLNALVSIEETGDQEALVREYGAGGNPGRLPEPLRATAQRLAPVGLATGGFYRSLRQDSRDTPYPSAAIERACAEAGLAAYATAVPAG
ncbi:protein kinase family protein [Streptacidiphilus sp. N1-12]|uniref:Protein kinase family protein n=2 Tax=Streptacidiphilus alkalitolerans TaxID=3342712 RepID=A0ABV6W7G2_9ACTN